MSDPTRAAAGSAFPPLTPATGPLPTPELRTGAFGETVRRLQRALRREGLYPGAIDGSFGGGTASAVRAFQRRVGLPADGVVGPRTWEALEPATLAGTPAPGAPVASRPAPIPVPGLLPALASEPLAMRCLALTASFETGAPPPECFATGSGDFDGQGMSYGALQWNLGQGTLQALLQDLDRSSPGVLDDVFGDEAGALRTVLARPRAEQLAWVRAIQAPTRRRLDEPWQGYFRALGRRPECQAAQVRAARAYHDAALELCRAFGLRSERAVALAFDICVQNGSISKETAARIRADFRAAPGLDEAGRLEIVANRRADAARPQWREDVRRRKLAIARGSGTVHGRHYELARDYAITLADAPLD
jgi:peptidoglycan hydrolase-like protein with peptidoglycan-binding domain